MLLHRSFCITLHLLHLLPLHSMQQSARSASLVLLIFTIALFVHFKRSQRTRQFQSDVMACYSLAGSAMTIGKSFFAAAHGATSALFVFLCCAAKSKESPLRETCQKRSLWCVNRACTSHVLDRRGADMNGNAGADGEKKNALTGRRRCARLNFKYSYGHGYKHGHVAMLEW